MKSLLSLFACLALTLTVQAQALYQKIDQFRLENGLLVTLIQCDTASGLVHIATYTRFGDRDDEQNTNGMASILLDAVYAGSKQYTTDSLRSVLNEYGTLLEVKQTAACTEYALQVNKGALEPVLQVLAESLIEARISEKWLQAEVAKLKVQTAVYDKTTDEQNALTVQDFVLGNMDLPKVEALDAITYQGIEEVYRIYFSPVNTALVITGAIDIATAKQWAKTYFSGWRTRLPFNPAIRRIDAKPMEGMTYAWLSCPEAKTAVFRYVKEAPHWQAKDQLSFQLCAAALEDFLRADMLGRVAASQVDCSVEYDPSQNNGVFAIKLVSTPDAAQKVDELIKESLYRFFQRGPAESQLRNAKAILKNAYLRQTPAELSEFFNPIIYTDLKDRRTYLQSIQDIEQKDFDAAFKKYMDPTVFSCVVAAPREPFGNNMTSFKRYTLRDLISNH